MQIHTMNINEVFTFPGLTAATMISATSAKRIKTKTNQYYTKHKLDL